MSMTFGTNVVPATDNTNTLGDNDARWKVYGSLFAKSTRDFGDTLPSSGSEGQVFFQIAPGVSASEIPAGGTAGQALVKHTNSDRDITWGTIHGLPEGGSVNQLLKKTDSQDGHATWATLYTVPNGGYAGQALIKNTDTSGDLVWSTLRTVKTGGSANQVLVNDGNGSYDWGSISTVPTGGNAGQALTKNSNSNGDLTWTTIVPTDGTNGQVLMADNNHGWAWTSVTTVPSGGNAGQALVKSSNTNYDVGWSDVGGIMEPVANTSTTFFVTGSTDQTRNTNAAVFDTNVYITGTVLHGACWNDYAEYRQTTEVITPGHCIVENGDGTLSLSTKRLQAGAEIVSDTFGFAIGETETCKTPIAVSGRVLAYGDKPANEFTIGAPVCSGENGTVSEMTEEEARNYPWMILGTVSAIPQEETWGANNVKVDGRVWIRVR